MNSMETNIDKASNLLLHLPMILGNALKMRENRNAVLPKLENLAVVESSKDIFRPTTDTPSLTDDVLIGRTLKGIPALLKGFLNSMCCPANRQVP